MKRSQLSAAAVFVAAAIVTSGGCARVGGRTTTGAVEELRRMKAETPEEEQLAYHAGQLAIQGATKQLADPTSKAAIGEAAETAARRALAGLHGELADGNGPIAQDLDVIADRMSATVLRRMGQGFDDTFGDCDGLDRRACLKRDVRELGKEMSAGFVDGIVGSHLWISALLVFSVGVAAALLVRAAFVFVGHRFPSPRRPARV